MGMAGQCTVRTLGRERLREREQRGGSGWVSRGDHEVYTRCDRKRYKKIRRDSRRFKKSKEFCCATFVNGEYFRLGSTLHNIIFLLRASFSRGVASQRPGCLAAGSRRVIRYQTGRVLLCLPNPSSYSRDGSSGGQWLKWSRIPPATAYASPDQRLRQRS